MEEYEDRSDELQSLFNEKEDDQIKQISYKDKLKGFLAGIFFVSAVTVSATCCQLLERRIPDFELNTIRMIISWVLMIVLLLVRRRLPRVGKFNLAVIGLYSLNTICITLPFFVAITLTAVSSAQAVLITSGIASWTLYFLVG